MAGKPVNWLLAAGLSLTTGCATTGLTESVARATASLNPWKHRPAVSEEMREAQRTLRNPEETLVCYARMKEDNQDYAEARERYREILVAYPQNVDAALGMARIERSTGRYSQAHEILSGLAARNPRNIEVQLELGRTFAGQQEWVEAVAAFEEAARLEPENQTCRFELGLALARANRINEALPHLTFAVGTSAAMYNIGYVFQERGQTADSIQWYQEALASNPDARTRQLAAAMLARLGERAEKGTTRVASRGSTPGETSRAVSTTSARGKAQTPPDRWLSSQDTQQTTTTGHLRDAAELQGPSGAERTTPPAVLSESRLIPHVAAPELPSAPWRTGTRAVRPASFSKPAPLRADEGVAVSESPAVPIRPWSGPSASRSQSPESAALPSQDPPAAAQVMDVPQWKARQ